MKHTSSLRRFGSHEIDPSQAIGLREDHPALAGQGRSIFPSTIVGSLASPRFLVSGHNNPKLGKEVLKGPRTGWPIFHLTLEERATCPRSCEQWSSCYGNAMPQARRHAVDDLFLPLLRAEIATVARANPKGLLIRLHALGDFYSVEYVLAWAEMLAMFPQLHVFGYTARHVYDDDIDSARIARAIAALTEGAWDRFAIRTSTANPAAARSRAIVVDEDPEEPDTIICPAQTGATEACATCGLCWSGAARDKTIAFLRHGMTSRGRTGRPKVVVADPPAPGRSTIAKMSAARDAHFASLREQQDQRMFAAVEKLAGAADEVAASIGRLAVEADIPLGSALFVLRRLAEAGKLRVIPQPRIQGKSPPPNIYRLLDRVTAPPPPTESAQEPGFSTHQTSSMARVHEALRTLAGNADVATASFPQISALADVPLGSISFMLDGLQKRDLIEITRGANRRPNSYRLLDRRRSETATAQPAVLRPASAPTPPTLSAPILARKPLAELPTVEAPRPKALATVTAAPATVCTPPRKPATVAPIEVSFEAPPGSLLSLRYGMCKWPLNTPKAGEGHLTQFCCKASLAEEPYCQAHATRSVSRGSSHA